MLTAENSYVRGLFIGLILFLGCLSLCSIGFVGGKHIAQIKNPEQFMRACMKSNGMEYNLTHSEYSQYLERCKQASKLFFLNKGD